MQIQPKPISSTKHKTSGENECRDVKFYVSTRVSGSALLNSVDVYRSEKECRDVALLSLHKVSG
jgi:hypothetical protein